MQVKDPFGQIDEIKSILTDLLKPSTQLATPMTVEALSALLTSHADLRSVRTE